MIAEAPFEEREASELGGALPPASVSDQLTISSRLIERVVRAGYPFEQKVPEDWPVSARIGQCPWLPFVRKQLQAIQSLPEGWDSYGARCPDAHLVASARSLIQCLARVPDLPQPHVNPTRNGGVQFEWEAGERYFELEIVAGGKATYYWRDRSNADQNEGMVFEGDPLNAVLEYVWRVEG